MAERSFPERMFAGRRQRGLPPSEQRDVSPANTRHNPPRPRGKAGFLTGDDRDHLYWELSKLRERILHLAAIDETLRNWSQGQLGKKTFQQTQEEFAELVNPPRLGQPGP